MNNKFKVEIRFTKNRHYPDYGPDAYSIEGHSIYIPYGKKFNYKSSNPTVEYVKNKITQEVLNKFDSIQYTIWKGYGGKVFYLKDSKVKSDSNPIDKEFIDNLFEN